MLCNGDLGGHLADGGHQRVAFALQAADIAGGGQLVQLLLQGGAAVSQLTEVLDLRGDQMGAGDSGGLQPVGQRIEPCAELAHLGGGLLQLLPDLRQMDVILLLLQTIQRTLHLLQRRVQRVLYGGGGVRHLLAVRQVLVDMGDGGGQRLGIGGGDAAGAAGGAEGVHHMAAPGQHVLGLVQQAFHRRLRVGLRQVGGQQIALLHDAADDHSQIVLADGALQRLHRRVGDLGGHGVLLGIFIVGDGGLPGPVREHPVHLPGEVLVDDHGGVVVAGVHAVHRLLLRVHDDPVDGCGGLQILLHVPALIDILAVVGVAPVQRRHGDGDAAGVAVGVPVGVDVQPCVQAGQQGNGHYHHAGKKALSQRADVRFEYLPDISHMSSVSGAGAFRAAHHIVPILKRPQKGTFSIIQNVTQKKPNTFPLLPEFCTVTADGWGKTSRRGRTRSGMFV